MKTLNLQEAAAFLQMHPEEVRTRTKRGLIPGAKIGRRWVFIEDDLAEFVRSLYPVKRQALPASSATLERAGWSPQKQRDYEELLKPTPRRVRAEERNK
jgi:hypothetical protein